MNKIQLNIIDNIRTIVENYHTSAESKIESVANSSSSSSNTLAKIGMCELEAVRQFRQIFQDGLAVKTLKAGSDESKWFYRLIRQYKHKLYAHIDAPQSLFNIRIASHILTLMRDASPDDYEYK